MNYEEFKYKPSARGEALAAAMFWLDNHPNVQEQIKNNKYMLLINMNEPSYRERMYLYDNDSGFVGHYHCAHGIKSSDDTNKALAVSFSNDRGSKKTSLGAFLTAEVYRGEHGKSLKLDGLEKGINSNARKRYIVIHPADYMYKEYISLTGRAGQSWGCPAVSPEVSAELIEKIKGGTFIYVYYDENK